MHSSKLWSILSKTHPFYRNITFENFIIISSIKPFICEMMVDAIMIMNWWKMIILWQCLLSFLQEKSPRKIRAFVPSMFSRMRFFIISENLTFCARSKIQSGMSVSHSPSSLAQVFTKYIPALVYISDLVSTQILRLGTTYILSYWPNKCREFNVMPPPASTFIRGNITGSLTEHQSAVFDNSLTFQKLEEAMEKWKRQFTMFQRIFSRPF